MAKELVQQKVRNNWKVRENNRDFNSFIHLLMEEMIGPNEPGKLVCRKRIEYSITSVGSLGHESTTAIKRVCVHLLL